MTFKLLEIRDAGTFIPSLAILISGADGYLSRRAGFGETPCVFLVAIATEKCAYDPYNWGNRTMTVAHDFILQNWDSLSDNDVIDVEFILGESPTKKVSEATTIVTASPTVHSPIEGLAEVLKRRVETDAK